MASITIGSCGVCSYFDQHRPDHPQLIQIGAKRRLEGVGLCMHGDHAKTALLVTPDSSCRDFAAGSEGTQRRLQDEAASSISQPSHSVTGEANTRLPGHSFVLQKVQPALLGLMDGSVSTLAPLFATAGLTRNPRTAFVVGVAASVGAAISMGLAEALSDDGKISGRGAPLVRGAITGMATALGGMLHTLPFLIPHLGMALHLAYAVVVGELLAIAYIRYRFMHSPLARTVIQVVIGGGIVLLVGVWLGKLGVT